MSAQSPLLTLRARGPYACFTRPELKVERVSYDVPTPSAAVGLLESVFWKPAIRWRIERIRVLNPVRFIAFRRNEVNSRVPTLNAGLVEDGGPAPMYFADDDRAQRNTVALRDVDYVIEARFSMTEKAGPDDNINKFVEMFTRRVHKGQFWQKPYFGCREMAADVMPADASPAPISETRDLGIMLWGIEYGNKGQRPIFFHARLEEGVLEVPDDPDATFEEDAS